MRMQLHAAATLAIMFIFGATDAYAQATKFVITGSGTQIAGVPQNLTIRADSSGQPATSYTGARKLIFSGATASQNPVTQPTVNDSGGTTRNFGDTTVIRFTNGLATVSASKNGVLRLYKAETATVSVTDGTISSPVPDRLTVVVSAAGVGKFVWSLTSPQLSGAAFTGINTLTAQDSWGNTVTDFSANANNVTITNSLGGTVTGLGTGNNNVLNKTPDFSSGVANLTSLGMIYSGSPGSVTFTATSAGPVATGISSPVTISSGTPQKLVITGQGTQVAGKAQNLTITARDGSNNVASSYAGVKSITFSGAQASPDGDQPSVTSNTGTPVNFGTATNISFVAGIAQVSGSNNGAMRLYTAETATIAATDGTISSSGADRLTVAVSPDSLGKFVFIVSPSQTNNVPFVGADTLIAQDEWGNIVPSFDASQNPVIISPIGLIGRISVGVGRDSILNQVGDFSSGKAILSGKLKYTGLIGTGQFKATSQPSGQAGTSGTVTIVAGEARRLVLGGTGSVGAGVANALTITARDTSGNVATGYTGTKTLGFSGANLSPDGDAPSVTDYQGTEKVFSWTPRNTDITFSSGVATVITGGKNGVMRLRKVEVASIAVSDGSIGTLPGSELSVSVSPAGLRRFSVILTSPQTNGVTFTGVNTVTAIDSFGNIATGFNPISNNVTMTAPGLGGTLSGLGSGGTNVLNQASDFVSGIASVSGKLKYTGITGSSVFTATSQSGRTGSTAGSIVINVGEAKRLVVTGSATQPAGSGRNLTITAKDSSGNTITTYAGDKSLVFSGSGPSANPPTSPTVTNAAGAQVPFGLSTTITFSAGIAQVSGSANGLMRLYRSGTDTIAVSDGLIGSGAGDRLIVTVSADALAKFVVSFTSPQQSGIAFTGDNTIVAQDSFGNTKTDFDASSDNVTVSANALGGVVSGLGSAANNVLNQFSDFVAGTANLTGKLKYTSQVGTTTFTAVNSTSKAGTSGNVQIVAGGATRLVIAGTPTMTAGGVQSLTITARDGSGNTVTSYAGNKSLIFSGADSSITPALPPTVTNSSGAATAFGAATAITFTAGIATVSGSTNGVMRLLRAQTAIISVSDGTISSSGSDRLTVAVSPAALGMFAWTITSPQTNGVAFTGTNTLTAQDDWGNTRTTFDASTTNVTITTTLSGTISGLGSGGINVLNRSNDFVAGVANLTSLGIKYTGAIGSGTLTANGGGKSGISGTLQIVAGGATRLVVRTVSNDSMTTLLAGEIRNLSITARDGSGNIVVSYSGMKQLTFSGADSSSNPATAPTVTNSSGTAIGFGTLTSLTFTNGVAQVSGNSNGVLSLYRAQTATIAVTDGAISSSGTDRLTATVSPGPLAKFSWVLSTPQVNGVAFTGINTLTAQDAWGNAVSSFDASVSNVTLSSSLGGTITGLGTGNSAVMNRATDFAGGIANLTALGMKYTGPFGNGTFTATASGKAGTSSTVAIVAGTASRLVITGSATQTAGAGQNLTITARDTSDNPVATYTGTKTLTFSGANPSTNPLTQPSVTNSSGVAVSFGASTMITFTNGVATVSAGQNGQMRLYKVESALISVTDGTISSTGTDRLSVTVSPGLLGQFAWTLTSPQVNGVNFTGTNTLVAQDNWGNAVPTFDASTNNVSITTVLPGSPGAITGLGTLGNNVLNRATDFVSGLANLTALGLRYTGSAGTGTFTATSATGSKTGVSPAITIDNPAPTIATVTPGEANRSQTIMVAITGTNFRSGVTTVSFGSNVTIDTIVVLSPTQMSVTVSIGAAAALGQRSVSVTNPTPGGGTATLPLAFRVKNIPTLISLSPSIGIRGQTYGVLITGTNFAEGVSSVGILGSNITLNSDTVLNPSTILANITIGGTAVDGVRQFTVTNGGPEGGTSNGVGFTVGNNPVPTLTSITPDTATRLQSLELTIKGTNFYQGISSVSLGSGITVLNTVIDSAKQIRLNVTVTDTAATGPSAVSVINAGPGGGTATLTNGFNVTNPVPTLSGISVQNGSRLQTLAMTLTGTRFINGVTTVSLGTGIAVNSTLVQSQTEVLIGFVIDSSAVLGPRSVTVSNPAPGGGSAQLLDAFTVNNPLPTITTLAPESTLVGGAGTSLQVNGTNFVPGSVVRLGALSLSTALVNRTQLTATIPASEIDTARSLSVSVFNSTPGGGVSNTRTFTVRNPAPSLVSITPSTGSRLQTLNVVFDGTNFVPGVSTVSFGGEDIQVNSITVTTAERLTANISILSTAVIGPRDVSVINPSPGGGISAKRTFTVADNPVPTLTTVNPASGPRLGRVDVIVSGSNFINGVTSVDFGPGIIVNQTTINSAVQLTATITIGIAAATGPRSVTVINAAPGGGSATKPSGFAVLNPGPTLSFLLPTNAQQLQRLNIVFDGTGFIDGVSTVNMGTGITINAQTVVSDTQITADITVTENAATGPRDVWVINLSPGGGSAVLTNGFVVGNNPGPRILSVTPATGKRLETIDLVIRGENYVSGVTSVDLGTEVMVNSVTVDSSTRLTANITVRAAASTGARTVYVTNAPPGGGRDSILSGFTVTNPLPTLTSATPSGATRSQTLNVVLRGTNFIGQATSANFGAGIAVNSVTVDSATRITANISVDAAATLGARNLVLFNPLPGGGNSTPIAFTVSLAPPPTPTLRHPGNTQPNLPTTFTVRWDSSAGATNYHLQVSVSSLFLSTAVDDSTITTTSHKIGPLLNNTTYYWRVRARNSGGTSAFSSTWSFTPSYPAVLILSSSVPFPNLNAASDYLPADYRLIGLPGTGSSLVSNFLSGVQGTDWQVYWDNGNPSNYAVKFDGGQGFTFSTGRAYWLIRKNTWTINASVDAAVLDTGGNAVVPLHRGWNLITNPFALDVPWTAVQSVNGQAAREPLWNFLGTQGFQISTILKTYAGYYFYNVDSVATLLIPYAGTSGVLKQVDTASSGSWAVGIRVSTDAYTESSARLGIMSEAEDGLDRFDYHKPRTMGALPGVVFNRPDLDPATPAFVTDIRRQVGKIARWPFELQASRGKEVRLEFAGVGSVPTELEIYLVDGARARYVNLREEQTYGVIPITDRSMFTVLIGGHEAVTAELDAVIPHTFALEQNFPNPFNPTTTIPLSVPVMGDVTVKVYSILGEEVRTLHSGVLERGRHWLTWDGRNDAGRMVATGMYLTRLTTPVGGSFIIKMLLMK